MKKILKKLKKLDKCYILNHNQKLILIIIFFVNVLKIIVRENIVNVIKINFHVIKIVNVYHVKI
jgi:hypothetical protein